MNTILGGGVAAVQYETPSYDNLGGTGDRTALITVTCSAATFTAFQADLSSMVDGLFAHVIYADNGEAATGKWVEWDFGTPKKFDKIKFYFDGTMNCGVAKIQGYINNAWVDVETGTHTVGASATQEITIDATGATKLRQLWTSGNLAWDRYWQEVEFSLGAPL